jgi:hypothetical protein
VGNAFYPTDIPELEGAFVHFAAPRFWCEEECINGEVKYVDASNDPKIMYIKPFGATHLVRVNVLDYEIVERIEENEQHSSH